MHQGATRRIGGFALIASAVALAAGSILASPGANSLEAFRALTLPTLSPWLMALAGLLWIGGAVVLTRQFNGSAAEGWAALAYAGALFGGVGLFLAGALGVYGVTGLATGTIFDHVNEAYTALSYTSFAVGLMGIAAYYAGVTLFGVAMVRTPGWPAWLGWSGVAVGAAVVLLHATGLNFTMGAVAMALYMLGLVWVAAAGWHLRDREAAPAAAPPRAVPVP